MSLPQRIRRYLLRRVLGGLRFPQLFVLTALVFVVDLLVPDGLPMVDEILLGLVSLLLAGLRKKEEGGEEAGADDGEAGGEDAAGPRADS